LFRAAASGTASICPSQRLLEESDQDKNWFAERNIGSLIYTGYPSGTGPIFPESMKPVKLRRFGYHPEFNVPKRFLQEGDFDVCGSPTIWWNVSRNEINGKTAIIFTSGLAPSITVNDLRICEKFLKNKKI
jgi:hypothetical protein